MGVLEDSGFFMREAAEASAVLVVAVIGRCGVSMETDAVGFCRIPLFCRLFPKSTVEFSGEE